MSIEAKPWPIDFDTVDVGRYFAPEELAEIFGMNAGDDRYRLAQLNLKNSIELKLGQRPVPLYVTVVIQGDGLRVLNHWEATQYSARAFSRHFRGLGSYLRRLGRIDTAEFDDQQKTVYEGHLNRCAQTYLGAKRGRRESMISAPAADTPKALPGA